MTRDLRPGIGAPLLSVEAAAELCGVSEKTIRRAIKAGELEGHKVRAQWRIRPEALDAFYEGEG